MVWNLFYVCMIFVGSLSNCYIGYQWLARGCLLKQRGIQSCTINVLAIDLFTGRLPQLPVVCMEDTQLSANTHHLTNYPLCSGESVRILWSYPILSTYSNILVLAVKAQLLCWRWTFSISGLHYPLESFTTKWAWVWIQGCEYKLVHLSLQPIWPKQPPTNQLGSPCFPSDQSLPGGH